VLFHPDGQSLIIHGAMGLYRWPIDRDPEHGADALTLGPPELLRESTGSEWNKAAWLPDHHTVAMIDNARARVVLVDSAHPHPARSRAVVLDSGENRRMTSVAVSADGHWLAVGGWKEAGIRVWDLRRRQLERLLRPNDDVSDLSFVVGFTPDGRWLVSRTGADSGGRHEFWRTGTWERGLRIDIEGRGIAFDRPAFTADGRSMALAIAPDQVMLADSATGREHVRLTTLRPIEPMPLAFSPDGTKLVAGTTQNTALVWDLRRIRDQLASRGLDWHAAPYPASPAIRLTPGPMGPVRPVRIIGEVLERQARRRAELAAMDRRLAVNPDDTEALSHRGWLFLTDRRTPEAIADLNHLHRLEPDCPDVDWMLGQAYQDGANPAGALALFDRILRREPDDQDTRFQRGLIAFALGRTQQAADDFARVLAADPTRDMVRYHHARTLNRLGRYRDALAEVDLLFTRHPNDFALFQLRGTACEAVGEREPARLAWEKAHSLLPNDAPELNKHARVMATGPLAGRDPERAVVLARQAVALAPDHSVYLNTLGAALYGVGRYAEAIDVLERSMKVGRSEPDGIDLFFLAMAHHGLGQPGRARTFLDRAVHWRDRKTGLSAGRAQELAAVRAEAEAVLAGPGGDLPIDVIAPL
jgi:tetratricopeptide (TPR) repeat protein